MSFLSEISKMFNTYFVVIGVIVIAVLLTVLVVTLRSRLTEDRDKPGRSTSGSVARHSHLNANPGDSVVFPFAGKSLVGTVLEAHPARVRIDANLAHIVVRKHHELQPISRVA